MSKLERFLSTRRTQHAIANFEDGGELQTKECRHFLNENDSHQEQRSVHNQLIE